ncbi:MAG TPA: ABC transporter permease subunit, partial [Ramlibacter sp.]|nr:ABC transporter permease subunit [Ramlibacter sp.]
MSAFVRFGPWLLLVLLLGAWEAACRAMGISALVLPAPSAIARALAQGLASGFFWPHLGATALELLLGVCAGSVLGLAAGIALGEHAVLRRLLMPYLVASQVIPKLALAPLFVLWFGFGMTSTVVITALICFFPLME